MLTPYRSISRAGPVLFGALSKILLTYIIIIIIYLAILTHLSSCSPSCQPDKMEGPLVANEP